MFKKLTMETIKEFDWCLDQLDTLKASMSISEMASNKVRLTKVYSFMKRLSDHKHSFAPVLTDNCFEDFAKISETNRGRSFLLVKLQAYKPTAYNLHARMLSFLLKNELVICGMVFSYREVS